jgi:hypothetical protein
MIVCKTVRLKKDGNNGENKGSNQIGSRSNA